MKTNYIFYEDKLKGEYKEAFKKVELYAAVNNITGDLLDAKMMELIDLMLGAQENGKDVGVVIGKDIEVFCKDYFKDYSLKNRLSEFARSIYRLAWVVFVIEFIPMLTIFNGEDLSTLKNKLDMAPFIVGFVGASLTSLLLNTIMKKITFKIKRLSYFIYGVFSFISVLVVVFLAINLFDSFNLAISGVVVLGSSLSYIICYKVLSLIYRKKNCEVSSCSKKEIKSHMKSDRNEHFKRQLAEAFVKRYHRANKKRIKQGKEELTKEEFMNILLKENEKLKKGNIVGLILMAVIVGGFILNVALTSTLMNTIIFTLIMIAIQVPLVYSTIIKSMQGKDLRTEMFNEMTARNLDVFQYLEKS